MCLLVLKPAGIRLPTSEEIHRAWTRNKDGGGFSFRDKDGTLSMCKGIFCVQSMVLSMEKFLCVEREAVIHLRYSTHKGDKTKNCHPHRIGDGGMGVCSHNGIIDIDHRSGESDTRSYVRQIITPLMTDLGGRITPALALVLGRDIGRGNKLVITPQEGVSVIVNEDEGVWQDGLWWSNRSAFASAPVSLPPPPRDSVSSIWNTYTPPSEADGGERDKMRCSECEQLRHYTSIRWRGGRGLCVDCVQKLKWVS
jgi:hypothetical protein